MCTVCGCGTMVVVDAPGHKLAGSHAGHRHDHGHEHDHNHDHPHGHSHGSDQSHDHTIDLLNFGEGPAGVSVPGMSQERVISIERNLLAKNDAYAAANREFLREAKVLALNFVSSPGSGKTSLLARAIDDLKTRWPIAVIEGDQQTSNDAERIRATGAQAVQINTGKGCHLDAHMVGHALEHIAPVPGGLLFIENVGNLVCPAAFDLGEAAKIVVLSVTEGEDKPLKYPDMFAAADLMLLNKADLLPYLEFDTDTCIAAALRVNPEIQILIISSKTGEGLEAFYAWIEARAVAAHTMIAIE